MTKDAIAIGNVKAEHTGTFYGAFKVGELNDSSPVEVPVCIVRGAKSGPVLWLQNAIHGDEYVGLGGIQWVLRDVRPEQLTGTIVAIPAANPLAFRSRVRSAPQDGMDANRSYPGKPLETAMHLTAHTELLVHELFRYMMEYADVVVDCHDGSTACTMAPYAAYYEGPVEFQTASRALALATGMTIVWRTMGGFTAEKFPNSLKVYLGQKGIPGVTLEVGGRGQLDREDVGRMHMALMNILRHLEMTEGQVSTLEPPIFINKGNWMRPAVGGVFWPEVRPTARVKKGDLFAVVTDLFGREKERLTCPADGVIVGVRVSGTTHSGEYCGNVGEIDHDEAR
jgi:predicted deacylase